MKIYTKIKHKLRSWFNHYKPKIKRTYYRVKYRLNSYSIYYKYFKSKQKIKKLVSQNRNLLIEVGAGEKKGNNGWITMDLTEECDIYWDLRRGLPFPDNSVLRIYSSHFLEHLNFKEGQEFLDECMRVLKSGGSFSICVPNSRLYLEAYVKNENLSPKMFIIPLAYNYTTRIDYVNYIAYMDGLHKYMFDEENLIQILKLKGMNNVRLRKFDPNIDLEYRDYESIYAEADIG